MEFDELAPANSGVVGVLFGAATDDVEDGMDALSGRVEEAILSSGVTTRNRLAGDFLVARSLNGERRLVDLGQGHDTRGVVHGGRR